MPRGMCLSMKTYGQGLHLQGAEGEDQSVSVDEGGGRTLLEVGYVKPTEGGN